MTTGSPIRSMTGFGGAAAEDGGWRIGVEIRSVNHRGLQWKGNFPPFLQALEGVADGILRARIARGSVNVRVVCLATAAAPQVRFDADLARAYAKQLDDLAQQVGLPASTRLETLLALPGVSMPAEAEPGASELCQLFERVLGEALDALDAAREREGAALRTELDGRINELENLLASIETRWPSIVDEYRARLERRVMDFLAEQGRVVDEVDVLREVAIWADRTDVAEETVRFRTHLEEVRRLLVDAGNVGRPLEFLGQELLREANTIASKAADADVAHAVVAMKTALDRVKEQAQNLE